MRTKQAIIGDMQKLRDKLEASGRNNFTAVEDEYFSKLQAELALIDGRSASSNLSPREQSFLDGATDRLSEYARSIDAKIARWNAEDSAGDQSERLQRLRTTAAKHRRPLMSLGFHALLNVIDTIGNNLTEGTLEKLESSLANAVWQANQKRLGNRSPFGKVCA